MSVEEHLKWKHPFTSIISGPTGCGKTVFVKNFLKNLNFMCNVNFEKILFYYGEWQSSYEENYGIVIDYREGLPRNEDYSYNNNEPKLIIIDDLMRESNNVISDLFTKGSHHKNLSVMFITQNVFHQGKNQRDISLNTNYLVLFKNPRDRAQIMHLSRQVHPEDCKFLQEAFYDATSKPHGYLLLDLKQSTPEEYRFRTNIFPFDEYNYVYVPRRKV